MRLINTIEIIPYDFSKNEYTYPGTTSAADPTAWNEFWLKSISDSGLADLEAIRAGSYLVDLTTISFENLSTIVKKKLAEIDLDDFESQASKIEGGVAVKFEGKIIIEPSCCGDLGNLSEWEKIFDSLHDGWQQIWIGHPWIFYKRGDGLVEFSDYTDLNLEDFKDIKAVYTLPEQELAQELKRIRKEQDDFTDKIGLVLTEKKVSHAQDISKLMTGAE
jgi:hypothetical protein